MIVVVAVAVFKNVNDFIVCVLKRIFLCLKKRKEDTVSFIVVKERFGE